MLQHACVSLTLSVCLCVCLCVWVLACTLHWFSFHLRQLQQAAAAADAMSKGWVGGVRPKRNPATFYVSSERVFFRYLNREPKRRANQMDERHNGPGGGLCLMTFAITITIIIRGVNSIHKATAQTDDTVSTKPDANSVIREIGWWLCLQPSHHWQR